MHARIDLHSSKAQPTVVGSVQKCTGANDAAGAQPCCRVGRGGLLVAIVRFSGVEAMRAESSRVSSGSSSIASLRQRMCVARALALAQGGDNIASSHEAGSRPVIAYVALA